MADYRDLAQMMVTQIDIDSGVDPENLTNAQILMGVKRYYSVSLDKQARRLLNAKLTAVLNLSDEKEIPIGLSILMHKGAIAGRVIPTINSGASSGLRLSLKTGLSGVAEIPSTGASIDEMLLFDAEATASGINVLSYATEIYTKYKSVMIVQSDISGKVNATREQINSARSPEAVISIMDTFVNYVNQKISELV